MKNQDSPIAHYRKSDGVAQSVTDHLKNVSRFSGENAGKIGLQSIGALVGLLHDLGKYSDEFQRYIQSATGRINPDEDDYVNAKVLKGKVDHSTAGAQLVWNHLSCKSELEWQLIRQVTALCLASHHSGLLDCLAPDGTDNFTARIEKSQEHTHFDEVCKDADKVILDTVNKLLDGSAIKEEFAARLKLLSEEQYSETGAFHLGLLTRFIFSALLDADRLDSADFENPADADKRYYGRYPQWDCLIEKLERKLDTFACTNKVDELRVDVSAQCKESAFRDKGLYQLTVPTGGGKTLASLRFALHHVRKHEMHRIIYVIPYTSIIDQNAAIARSIFEDDGKLHQIVLEHHSNLTPVQDTWQGKLLAENWDTPIIFTTAVQFLETLFAAGTRGARRMHQLANSVIVFDEIQTIPITTIHLFNNAINFLVKQCGSTVVFCTATQPLLHRVDADKGAARLSLNSEIMNDVPGLFSALRRVEVIDGRKPGGWSVEEVADQALADLNSSGSVLIIVNTKAAAKDTYRQCRANIAPPVFHLSTSMCPAHRLKVLDKVREMLCLEQPVICVSTQLIEAGVDVDFGSVIRALAGLDSIAQAAGRCNRNGKRKTGRVTVFNQACENLDMLPDIRIAKEKAERVMDEYKRNPSDFENNLISPKAMELFYQYYFFDRANQMDYPLRREQIGREDSMFSLLSTNTLSVQAYKRTNRKSPPLCLRQSFKTAAESFAAINASTEGVIVPYGKEGKSIIANLCSTSCNLRERLDLVKHAQRYSVNLFPNVFRALCDKEAIKEVQPGSGIMYLDSQYYSQDFGISLESVEGMPFLNA